MKKLIVIGATALATLFVVLGTAPSASAYPETTCNVTVDAQKVASGTKLEVHGTAAITVTDDGLGRKAADVPHWVATFANQTRTADTDDFNTTFDIPTVTSTTKYLLKVKATMPDGTTNCEKSLEITVLPGSSTVVPPEGPNLPNTGGPRLLLLIAGLGLVVAGSLAIRQSRRRHEPAGRHA